MNVFVKWLSDENVLRSIFDLNDLWMFPPLEISNSPRRGFKPMQSVFYDLIEWRVEVVIASKR